MKKILCFVLILALLLVAATGCMGKLSDAMESAVKSAVEEEMGGTASGEDAGTPSEETGDAVSDTSSSGDLPLYESYTKYTEAKSALTTNMSNALSEDTNLVDLAMTGSMDILGISFADLMLIPLTVCGMDDTNASTAALAMLGMEGVKISNSGNTYTVEYSDSEGGTVKIESKYDLGSESMSSTLTENGEFYLMSEYTKISGGYAGQIYFSNDDGTFETVKIVTNMDGSEGTIGVIRSGTSEPSSIFQKGDGVGAEFAELLEAAGVDTVPELALRKAENLTKKMEEVNSEKKLCRRTPSLKEVSDWISEAKTLPRALEY